MANLLDKYQKMRDFGSTPEPSGKSLDRKSKELIFVVQKHQASQLHYDFRLELEGVLKSWAVPKGPSYDPGTKRLAMMTEDHPYDYAGFEGVIPEGNYGAGNVIIWDNGTWEYTGPDQDPVTSVRKGNLKFVLHGRKLFGEWALVRIARGSPKGNEWLLIKHRDRYANDTLDVTVEAPLSIISGRSVESVSGKKQWKSDRMATAGRKAPTIASALAAKRAGKRDKGQASTRKRASGKKAAAKKRTGSGKVAGSGKKGRTPSKKR